MTTLANYINGTLTPPESGRYLDDFEPATGSVYAQTPASGTADLEAAVAAAKQAFSTWSRQPAAERACILIQLAELIEQRMDELVRAESIDTGKPVSLARRVDIPRAAANMRFYAAAATQFASEAHPMDDGAVNYTLRQPLGVVGCISPWNLPLYLFTWKIAPALAAGNCVIAKPSEVTPMTAHLFGKLCREAGLPAGVLNILHGIGDEIGAAIVEHPDISAISFTGGTRTGADIAARTAASFKKLSLELGGKNPNIVFADCDLTSALETSIRAAFSNQGQICLCGSRLFIEAPIYSRFRDAFLERTHALRLGDPRDPETDQGAVVSEAHMEKVLGCIERARDEGGAILTGGRRAQLEGRCRDGWFIEPTVIEGLDAYCKTNQEEIFGPAVSLIPFDTEDEVIEYANSTTYGLAASLWSRDVSRCHRVAARLDSGIIWINTWMLRDLRTPMGGMKHSGLGREGGFEAMRFFTEAKNVCIRV
jgi:aminomuconate-semialdehyde/2-hydroxymuconate-6-semialdehyde dehydrogenase